MLVHNLYSKNQIKIKDITFTGMMTSLSIIFFMIGGFINIPLASYLFLDFSVISIVGIYLHIKKAKGLIYALISCFLVGCFGFAIHTPRTGDFVGPIINIVSNSLFIILFSLFFKIKYTRKIYFNFLIALSLAVICIAFLLSFLNGIIFVPLYSNLGFLPLGTSSISFVDVMNAYNNNDGKILLGINSYWGGIFAIFFSFNIIKFSINAILLFIVQYSFKKSKYGLDYQQSVSDISDVSKTK